MEYEVVIGLEVHVQLATRSKIFFGTSTQFGAEPNSNIDPLTCGLPGTLPVLNKSVVESAIALGLATNCEIRRLNRFARKHYFYPDLPKGYQISQFEEPICERGNLTIVVNDSQRNIGITRIHMEEDAGKSIHDPGSESSLVDLNRTGVPLLEVVSEPDLRSPLEASAYLKALRQLVRFLEISDGNMEEGSLRCDANVSLRPEGQLKFGTRTEIKNINSFRFVERAIEYEIARQMSLLKNGEEVVQETRLFDADAGATRTMRSKEESADYRYFPDPDLPPIVIEDSWIHRIKTSLPMLPGQYIQELTESGLSASDAVTLTAERHYIDFYYKVLSVCQNAKSACAWVTNDLFGLLRKEGESLQSCRIKAENLGRLIQLIDDETISGKMAKTVFEEMFKTGAAPDIIIKEKGLKQITGDDEIRALVQAVFDDNEDQLAEFLSGKEKMQGFFVGQVMKASQGAANPKKVNDLIREEVVRRRQNSKQ